MHILADKNRPAPPRCAVFANRAPLLRPRRQVAQTYPRGTGCGTPVHGLVQGLVQGQMRDTGSGRSAGTNGGNSWEPVSLPVEPNSVVYWLGTHPERPNVIVAASLFGYLYVSEDGGDSWKKLKKEFGEIRSVVVVPN